MPKVLVLHRLLCTSIPLNLRIDNENLLKELKQGPTMEVPETSSAIDDKKTKSLKETKKEIGQEREKDKEEQREKEQNHRKN